MGSLLALALGLEEWIEGWDRWAMPRSVHAERRTMLVEGTPVRTYEDGCAVGAPLLLVHSLELFASSFEMRRLFELFRHERPCAAIDLPGFGMSIHHSEPQGVELLTAALEGVVRDLSARHGAPVDLVAALGSSNLAWSVALAVGRDVRSLTLICPKATVSSSTPTLGSLPGLAGVPLYRMLGTRAALRWHLGRLFGGDVDEPFLTYATRAARVRGAWGPGAARLAGSLAPLEHARSKPLALPVHVVRDAGVLDPAWRDTLDRSHAWEDTHLPTLRGLLHYEFACSVARAMRPFLRDLDAADAARRLAQQQTSVPRAR